MMGHDGGFAGFAGFAGFVSALRPTQNQNYPVTFFRARETSI
jgi:hypothetical protein